MKSAEYRDDAGIPIYQKGEERGREKENMKVFSLGDVLSIEPPCGEEYLPLKRREKKNNKKNAYPSKAAMHLHRRGKEKKLLTI